MKYIFQHFINSVLEDSNDKLPNIAISNNPEKKSLTETKV